MHHQEGGSVIFLKESTSYKIKAYLIYVKGPLVCRRRYVVQGTEVPSEPPAVYRSSEEVFESTKCVCKCTLSL